MAQWNLSVDLRGQGTSLARTLRQNAGHARTLSAATRDAQGQVRSLGQAAQGASGQVRSLGQSATGAGRNIRRLGSDAQNADRNVTRLGDASDAVRARLGRMATQARGAAREMRQLAQAAGQADARLRAAVHDVRIAVRLDDQTGPDAAAIRAAVAELNRLSPIRLAVNFDGDPAQVAATAAAMRNLRNDAQRTGTALGALAPEAATSAAALRLLMDAAQDTSRALRTLRGRAAATAAALDDLNGRAVAAGAGLRSLNTAGRSADTRLGTLSGRTRTLRDDLDDLDGSLTRVGGRMGGLSGTVGGLASSSDNASAGTSNLMASLIALGTALIPVAASVAPLAAGLTAAGAGVAAFGIAIGGQIKALTDATEAQDAYDKAVREHGKASPEAAKAETELVRQMQEMPPATRKAAAGLSVLKDEYKDWSDSLAGDTMPLANKSFSIFSSLFPKLTPLVQGTSREMDRFMNIVAGGINSSAFDRFMANFATFSEESLARANSALIRFTQNLNTGQIGGDLREFLNYAKTNGPLVGETLGNLAKAMTNLLVAASDMGVSVLTAVNVLAQLVNAVPPEVLSVFLQLAAAIKLVTLSAAALGAVTGSAAIARLGAYFAVMRAAGVSTTLRATAASMTGMQKAAVGLGVLTVAAIGVAKLAENARGAPPDVDRLTTSLKRLSETGKFTGELKNTFGDVDGLVKKIGEIGDAAKQNEDYVKSFGNSGLGPLDDLRSKANELWQDFTKGEKSLTALGDDFSALDEAMAGMVSSGYGEQAATDFDVIEKAAKKAGYSTKEIAALFPEYQAAVASVAAEQQLAANAMGLFGAQAQATSAKLAEQKASADGLRQAIVALNDVNRAALGGMIGFEAGIDAAAKAAKENAGSLRMVNGELDLNSPKAQAAATALQDLGAKTDEAASAARESGKSWEYTNGIYERGTQALINTGMQMGLTRQQATALAGTILTIPNQHSTQIQMRTEDAIAGLDSVIGKIRATPGAKSVTVRALTQDAISMLESLGFKVTHLKDGRFKVTAVTGSASANIAALQRQRDGLKDKSITFTTTRRTVFESVIKSGGTSQAAKNAAETFRADGGIDVAHYAGGGMRENHVAQIARAGTWRVWAEDETGGEAYIPLALSKRARSKAIAEETVRRLGGKGVEWHADGNVTDWRYDPTTGSLYSPSDAGSAGNKTKKVKGKDVAYFDLTAVEKKLKSTSAATRAWNKDLEKVADRVGGDVAEALAAMGKDGVALTKKMANGSTKYINDMATALRNLATTAKASLTDYTRQVNKATATDNAFAANLAKLAGQGYGELAKQLAAQNDTAAQQLAAAAVTDKKKASAANTAAGKANNALTSDQVQDLVAIIAAVKTNKTGIHDVAGTTGLGEDVIIAVASKATSQIKSALGTRATKFLADLARGQKGMSYADGGIRAGMYATQGGIVRFAEPETHGEALIPLGPNKRTSATKVLADVASRFGVGLTDVSSGRPTVIIRQGGDTHVTVNPVRSSASASDIASQVGRSVRRASRGGVAARAGA